MEIINPDDDYVWIHDYHLMLLPSFLRKRFNAARIGFFLHCPFPSSEVFRTFPVRAPPSPGPFPPLLPLSLSPLPLPSLTSYLPSFRPCACPPP